MDNTHIDLSPAEWEIMNTVWEADEPITVWDVIHSTYPNGEKAYNTVQTFMSILLKKGVLQGTMQGRRMYFTPTIKREDTLNKTLEGVATRMFGGSFGSMAAFLMDSEKLTPDDILRIQQIIDKLE